MTKDNKRPVLYVTRVDGVLTISAYSFDHEDCEKYIIEIAPHADRDKHNPSAFETILTNIIRHADIEVRQG